MPTTYNAPKSDYNKDETFAVLNITDGAKVEFSECVIKENDDAYMLYAYVTAIEKVTCFGDKSIDSDAWKPQLCKFKVLKKEVTIKEKTYAPTPSMLILQHFLSSQESRQLKGWVDFGKSESERCWIIDGVNSKENPTPLPADFRKTILDSCLSLEPIAELDKLKGIEIPELAASGSYGKKGGYSGQTEKAKLEDRAAFLLAQLDEGSTFYQMAEKLGYQGTDAKQFVGTAVSDLLSRVIV